MSKNEYTAPWIFIIDTDSYSGNFERQMCAYATGSVGECGVGDEEAEMFFDETGFDGYNYSFGNIIQPVADERGCRRPCYIWPTAGRLNNGMGTNYNDGDPIPEVNLEKHGYKDAADFKQKTGFDPGVGRFPAYESVAIFFERRPSDEDINMMKVRCRTFAATKEDILKKPYCKILGFQLIEQIQTVTEIKHEI